MGHLVSLCGVGCVDPLRVDVDGFCEVWSAVRGLYERSTRLTVYFALIALITDPADELCHTLLPVESDSDRLVVVAKETSKCAVCNILSTWCVLVAINCAPKGSFLREGPGFFDDFFRLPIGGRVRTGSRVHTTRLLNAI
jgi:hypothetical protein